VCGEPFQLNTRVTSWKITTYLEGALSGLLRSTPQEAATALALHFEQFWVLPLENTESDLSRCDSRVGVSAPFNKVHTMELDLDPGLRLSLPRGL
jgi:hypothetical protein